MKVFGHTNANCWSKQWGVWLMSVDVREYASMQIESEMSKWISEGVNEWIGNRNGWNERAWVVDIFGVIIWFFDVAAW